MAPLRFVYAASEVAGFAKTGGLADVAAALPRAERGLSGCVIMPLYRCVREGAVPIKPTGHTFSIPFPNRAVSGSLWEATLPDSDVPVYLIEQPHYYERDDAKLGRGLYQYSTPDGGRHDYGDNCERFVFFCQAVLEALRLLDFWPDVLHVNDWQTGLVPVYLKELHARHPKRELRPKFQNIRTLLTIHNLAYQGMFWHLDMPLTGLPWRLFNYEQLEFHGHLNLLKSGIVFSDRLNTVSPTYAREIQTPYFGCGLHGLLATRQKELSGIVNGVDYRTWNPATDTHIAATYDASTIAKGKPLCKRALQKRYGLVEDPRAPLLGMVTRLVDQKGVDLLVPIIEALVVRGAQLVVLGDGDPVYKRLLEQWRERQPRYVGLTFGHDEALAHQIEAGADMFLMPSQYEPCGLSQLYSLKYGTVPVVRATGGLVDTVADRVTGFAFQAVTPAALLEAIDRALAAYRDPEAWLKLIRAGMAQDWSWGQSAAAYEKLYKTLAGSV